jgi:GPI ethanolamine phosphate transferase 1
MISTALEAIDYYQTYYKFELLVSNTLAMLGWIVILIFELTSGRVEAVAVKYRKKIGAIVGGLAAIIVFFNFLQHTPAVATVYFTLPVFVWGVVAAYALESLNSRTLATLLVFVSVYVVAAAVLVYSFFDRRILSVFLAVNCLYQISTSSVDWWLKGTWAASTLCLFVFPMLPIIKKNAEHPLLL